MLNLQGLRYMSMVSLVAASVALMASASAAGADFLSNRVVGAVPIQAVNVTNQVTDTPGNYRPYIDVVLFDSKANQCYTFNNLGYLATGGAYAAPGMGCDAITKVEITADNSSFSPPLTVWSTAPVDVAISAPVTDIIVKADVQPVFNSDGSIKTQGTIKTETLTRLR